MKSFFLVGTLAFLGSWCLGQSDLSDEQVTRVLETLEQNGGKAAAETVESLGVNPYEFGLKLRVMGHHDEALKWFIAMIENSSGQEKANFYYGKAWIHFRRGEYQQALDDGELVLSVEPTQKTSARTYYMLGMIYLHWDEYGSANANFEYSKKQYEALGSFAGMYLCTAGQAQIAILQQDFVVGTKLLDEANEYRIKEENPYSIAFIRELEASIAFMQGDYEAFIEKAHIALDEYEADGKENNALWINIQIGLGYALVGRYADAYDQAFSNDQIIRENNDVKAAHYNNLTRMLYRRCNGMDYADMKKELLEWTELQRSSKTLTDLLALVETAPCH